MIDWGSQQLSSEQVAAGEIEFGEPDSNLDAPTAFTPFSSGNDTVPAPSSSSGCRNVWTTVSEGVLWNYYKLKNNLYFCYNKSTKKVSNAKSTWTIVSHDKISDINNPYVSVQAYYNYKSWGTRSGYKSQRTWKVVRPVQGQNYYYYPRADIYAHGDGSAYGSWTTS